MDAEDRLDLIEKIATNKAWEAILAVGRMLLDEFYPQSIFKGASGELGPSDLGPSDLGPSDLGPNYIVALREALDAIDKATSKGR